MPTLADYLSTMRSTPTATSEQGAGLLARLERVAYLFRGQTSVRLDRPLTIFSIKGLHERWYAFMTFIVGQFLLRHRAVRHDERYLAYLVEEASYLFSHPAAEDAGAWGAQLSQTWDCPDHAQSDPQEFLREGAVILQNAGTSLFLGNERACGPRTAPACRAGRTAHDAPAGEAVMRMGQASAASPSPPSPLHRRLFSTTRSSRARVVTRRRALTREKETH